MAYFRVCPNCGSNLDPGEKCDCEEWAAKDQERKRKAAQAMHNAVCLPNQTNQYTFKMAVGYNDR